MYPFRYYGLAIRCITILPPLHKGKICFGTGGRIRTHADAVLETTALPLSYTGICGWLLLTTLSDLAEATGGIFSTVIGFPATLGEGLSPLALH